MNQEPKNALGKNIKYLREQRGYSQKELGDLLGVSQRAISSWESGQREPDTINMALKICKLFRVQFEELTEQDLTENKVFQSAKDAVMFLLNQQELAAMGGFNPEEMTDDEILAFTQEAQRMMKMLALEQKNK